MYRCSRCDGFVPKGEVECPNCRSSRRAWWLAPLAFATAGLATVTLSACYGTACTANIKLPDGGSKTDLNASTCGTYDCNVAPDGGTPLHDSEWDTNCK
jgi:hypothetical protein